jgi:hypothetical protein
MWTYLYGIMKHNSMNFILPYQIPKKQFISIVTLLLTRRLLDGMIGFIALYTFTTRDYRQYSAIADLHTLQFRVTHALMISFFASRILAADL